MIFDLLETMPYTTNCYLIGDEAEKVCALVDPGGSLEAVRAMVERSGLKLEKIFLTHGHYDARLFPPLPCGFNCWEDGALLNVGALSVQVLHTPGHSAGSVTLLAEDVMLCGDTLFAGSCGRWDLTGGDYETLMGSLGRLWRLEGDYKVCPGHGPLSTLERERRTNPHLRQAMGV